LSEPVAWNDPPADIVWNEWGARRRVRVEHGPVLVFARSVKDDNPLYASEAAATTAGFPGVPAPPTFTFVMTHAGALPDLQVDEEPPPVDMAQFSRGGLYLHGEQHFTYHRPVCVGDILEGRTRTSHPVERSARRGPMQVTWYQTRWTELTGEPVVDEQIVSLYFPE
jgi:acyl dehydratase